MKKLFLFLVLILISVSAAHAFNLFGKKDMAFKFENYKTAEEIKRKIHEMIVQDKSFDNLQINLEKVGVTFNKAIPTQCADAYFSHRKNSNFSKWFNGMVITEVYKNTALLEDACRNVVLGSYKEENSSFFHTTRYVYIYIKYDDNRNIQFIEVIQAISGMP